VDYLCDECRAHFGAVRRYLDQFGIPYTVSHRLVRGLDYYTRTTFEVLAGTIGAQNALLGGGRYDGLVKHLGGPDRVGIGFAAGIERLVLALPETLALAEKRPDVFIAALGEPAREASLGLLRDLRRAGLNAQIEYEGRSLKSQMKRADRLKAPLVFILGDDELARGEVTVRRMASSSQESIPLGGVVEFVKVNR
jgi:histidyl-tRNA synthetase